MIIMKGSIEHLIDEEDDGQIKIYDSGCFNVTAGAIKKDGKRELVPSEMQLRCAEHSVTAAWIKTLRQWQYYHLVKEPTSNRNFQPKWRGIDVAVSVTPLLPRKSADAERKDKKALEDMCAGRDPTPETPQVDGCAMKTLADCGDDSVAMVLIVQKLAKMDQVLQVVSSPGLLRTGTAVDSTADQRRAVVQFARALGEARRSEMADDGDFQAPEYAIEVVEHQKRESDGKDCYLLSFKRPGCEDIRCLRSWSEYEKAFHTMCRTAAQSVSVHEVSSCRWPKFPSAGGLWSTPPEQRLQDLVVYAKQWVQWDVAMRKEHGFSITAVHGVRMFLIGR